MAIQTRGVIRQSNIEMLRTLAMLLVLVVHFNGALKCTDEILIDPHSWQGVVWTFVESVSICCVNIFVLISGWFGIHPTLKGLATFIFQVTFFAIICFNIALALGLTNVSDGGILYYFLGLRGDWFTKAYLLLYLLSPVLNNYIASASKKALGFVIIGFFFFQTLWGWYFGVCDFFKDGYSTISFVGLYLLAAYSRRYLSSISVQWLIICILGCICINTVCSYTWDPMGDAWTFLLMNYINPIVILQSWAIVVLFSRINLHSPIVNWIAISSYAIYLTHKNHFFFDSFCDYSRHIFSNYSGFSIWGVSLLFIAIVFFTSIFIDKTRLFLWAYCFYL